MLRTVRRGAAPVLCCLAATLLTSQSATADATPPPASANSQHQLWATQLQFDNNGTPWSNSDFAALKAKGINSAELNMPWGSLEPSQGTFDFAELDQELASATAAGIRLVPIFWQSGWRGSPAPWITNLEVTSTGGTGIAPAWWDQSRAAAFSAYVTSTIAHVAGNSGFGGVFIDYGRPTPSGATTATAAGLRRHRVLPGHWLPATTAR